MGRRTPLPRLGRRSSGRMRGGRLCGGVTATPTGRLLEKKGDVMS